MGTFRVETFLSTMKVFFLIHSLIFLFFTFPFSLTLLILLLLVLLPLGLSLKKDSHSFRTFLSLQARHYSYLDMCERHNHDVFLGWTASSGV